MHKIPNSMVFDTLVFAFDQLPFSRVEIKCRKQEKMLPYKSTQFTCIIKCAHFPTNDSIFYCVYKSTFRIFLFFSLFQNIFYFFANALRFSFSLVRLMHVLHLHPIFCVSQLVLFLFRYFGFRFFSSFELNKAPLFASIDKT